MDPVRRYRLWRDALWDKAMTVRWLRRAFFLVVGAFITAFPVYVLWLLALSRKFTVDRVTTLAWAGVCFVLLLLALSVAIHSSLGLRRASALVAMIPGIGGIFVFKWSWELSSVWHSRAERDTDRDQLLAGLGVIEREVYRLRFDLDEDRLYSRRKTAQELNVTRDRVREAERAIFERAQRDDERARATRHFHDDSSGAG